MITALDWINMVLIIVNVVLIIITYVIYYKVKDSVDKTFVKYEKQKKTDMIVVKYYS